MPTRIKEHDTDGFQLNGDHLEDVNLVGINDGEVVGWDETAGEFVAIDLDLDGKVDQTEFDDHSARHESGGADEINVGGLNGVLADRQDADKLQGHDIQDAAPADGQILIWNESESRYEPQDPPAQIDELNDVPDVSADTPSQGDILIFEGDAGGTDQWDSVENVLRVHTDVSPLAPSDGQVLTWDSADSLWKPEDPAVGALDLDDLGDVAAASPSDGDVLAYDSGANEWQSKGPPAVSNVKVFESDGSYTPSSGVTHIMVEVIGGGGGGGVGNEGEGGGGGGGAGYALGYLKVSELSPPVSITIGSGGSGATGTSGSGGSGGTSSFGTHLSATGGTGGASWDDASANAAGGSGTDGDLNLDGQRGGRSGLSNNSMTPPGGAAPRYGFISPVGTTTGNTPGFDNDAYGSGGSGGTTNNQTTGGRDGGAGGDGVVIVTEYSPG